MCFTIWLQLQPLLVKRLSSGGKQTMGAVHITHTTQNHFCGCLHSIQELSAVAAEAGSAQQIAAALGLCLCISYFMSMLQTYTASPVSVLGSACHYHQHEVRSKKAHPCRVAVVQIRLAASVMATLLTGCHLTSVIADRLLVLITTASVDGGSFVICFSHTGSTPSCSLLHVDGDDIQSQAYKASFAWGSHQPEVGARRR